MMFLFMLACAVKDGADVLRIQNSYHEHVKDIPTEELSFEQSMAKLYMQKSWEEYTNAQYQDALTLAVKCDEWLQKSMENKNDSPGLETPLEDNPQGSQSELKEESEIDPEPVQDLKKKPQDTPK